MAGAGKIRQEVKKELNWYGSMVLPKEITEPRIFARVQSLNSRLLEDSVLRVDADIRLFIVGGVEQDVVQEDEKPAIRTVSKDVETNNFIKLRNVDRARDVTSVRHDVGVDKVDFRGDRVSVIGTLSIEITYFSAVVLEGHVIEFPRGNPVKNATIKVKDMRNGKLLATTSTGSDGRYGFAEIAPGTFMVEVEAEGFQKEERVAVVMLRDMVDFTLHRLFEDASEADLRKIQGDLSPEQ